jgi:uncharacterized protein YjeT (DUF2065 family)
MENHAEGVLAGARTKLLMSYSLLKLALARSVIVYEGLSPFTCPEQDLVLLRGNVKLASGATARFVSVYLSSIGLPPFTKVIIELVPARLADLPYAQMQHGQSIGFHFPDRNQLLGVYLLCLHECDSSEGADTIAK